jgi:hypothetical protein
MVRPVTACCAALLSILGWGAAEAAQFQFAAAPEIDLNRIYRVNTATGEVGACQYALSPQQPPPPEQANGVTLCYPAGQGAGPQTPSDYGLVASKHQHEAGIFRVDLRSGAMSICYVLNNYVVCTPPTR